jgi:small subunit ribosomal protein S6
MANYEIVYILSPSMNEDELSGVINKIGDIIQRIGGSVTEIIQWGRKKMAYPIKKHSEGNYVLAKVDIPPSCIKELEASLRLSGEVLRHLIVKLDE